MMDAKERNTSAQSLIDFLHNDIFIASEESWHELYEFAEMIIDKVAAEKLKQGREQGIREGRVQFAVEATVTMSESNAWFNKNLSISEKIAAIRKEFQALLDKDGTDVDKR